MELGKAYTSNSFDENDDMKNSKHGRTYSTKRKVVCLKHMNNLPHFWSLTGIQIYTPEADQQRSFQSPWSRLHFNEGIYKLFCTTACYHSFEPINQVHLTNQLKGVMMEIQFSIQMLTRGNLFSPLQLVWSNQ